MIETTRLTFQTTLSVALHPIGEPIARYLLSTGIKSGNAILSITGEDYALTLLDESTTVDAKALTELAAVVRGHSHSAWHEDRIDDADLRMAPGVICETLTFPVADSSPDLGTWTGLFLLDVRGPRNCDVDVTVVGA